VIPREGVESVAAIEKTFDVAAEVIPREGVESL